MNDIFIDFLFQQFSTFFDMVNTTYIVDTGEFKITLFQFYIGLLLAEIVLALIFGGGGNFE